MKNKFKIKSIEFLKTISTKRLLSYYKARRREKILFVGYHTCECCGETDWDLSPKQYSEEKEQYEMIINHLSEVKQLLNSREHLKR